MSERISIAALRQAIADNARYSNGWPEFAPEPEEVAALLDVVDAALKLCGPTGPDGQWEGYHDPHGDDIYDHLIPALARFDFGDGR